MASFLIVVPLILVLVAVIAVVRWVRYRGNRHADTLRAVGDRHEPRERELEAIRLEHEMAAAGVHRSSGTGVAYPTDAVPGVRRSGHGAPGQSGSRVPYPEGAGPDAEPLA